MPTIDDCFPDLDTDLAAARKKREEIETLYGLHDQQVQYLQEVSRIKEKLAKHQGRDPGKYGPAYFFVADYEPKDGERLWHVRTAAEPALMHEHERQLFPVLALYEQTEDGLDGDTWEAEVFVLLPDQKLTLGKMASGYRMLGTERDGAYVIRAPARSGAWW